MTPENHPHDSRKTQIIKPYLHGQDVERWHAPWTGLWMIFARRGIEVHRYPSVLRHLERFRQRLEPKPDDWRPAVPDEKWSGRKEGTYAWYEIQDSVEYWKESDKPKIIYQAIQYYASYARDDSGLLLSNKAFFLPIDSPSLLAALNSPLGWWVSWRHFLHMKDEALSNDGVKIATFPVAMGLRSREDQLDKAVSETISLVHNVRRATGRYRIGCVTSLVSKGRAERWPNLTSSMPTASSRRLAPHYRKAASGQPPVLLG